MVINHFLNGMILQVYPLNLTGHDSPPWCCWPKAALPLQAVRPPAEVDVGSELKKIQGWNSGIFCLKPNGMWWFMIVLVSLLFLLMVLLLVFVSLVVLVDGGVVGVGSRTSNFRG